MAEKTWWKYPVCTVLAMAVLIGAGCGGKKDSGEEKQGKKIAGIVFQEDQFFRLIQFGMQDAADRAGAELLLGNSAGKPDKEVQLINTYIVRQVDAIVISPLSSTASATALKKARDKGIQVITYNSTVEGDVPLAYIESDQMDLGAQTGQVARRYIEEQLGGKAKVAMLAFKSQLPEPSDARSNGFKSAIEDLPGVEIVAEQDAWLAEMAIKKVGDILTANPDISVIWAANEGGTVGAVMAVKNAGKAGKVAVFGTDTSDQLIGFLLMEDGILQAITGQKPFEIGGRAVDTALELLDGKLVETKVSMSGVLLERGDRPGIEAFRKRLQDLIARGD